MCNQKACILILSVLVGFFSILYTRPDLILPHKINAAISLKGWDGFSKIIVANIAQRQKGQRTTKSREAWYRLLGALRDIDVEYLSPRSDVVTETEIAQVRFDLCSSTSNTAAIVTCADYSILLSLTYY